MPPTPKSKVIIIDDDLAVLETLNMALELKYNPYPFSDARIGLKRAEEGDVPVALVDVHMQEVPGKEILKLIKKAAPATEVIMITADKEIETALECFELGAYDYITKPFNIEALLAVVARATQKYELAHQIETLKSQVLSPRKPTKGKVVQAKDLKTKIHALAQDAVKTGGQVDFKGIVDELERALVLQALLATNWNQVHAARLLQVNRQTVITKMKDLDIPRTLRKRPIKAK